LVNHHQPIGRNAVNTCFLDTSIPEVKRRVLDERGSILGFVPAAAQYQGRRARGAVSRKEGS
jgi:hypothetical protein